MGLFDVFSSDNAEEAARLKAAGLRAGFDKAQGFITTGLEKAEPYYDRALAPFGALSGTANKGYDLYADATGVNGADGAARARASFQAGPGFDFALNTANDLLERRAAARGQLAGGNTIDATTKLATNMANQEYGNWVNRLAPYLQQAPGNAAAQADILTRQAGMYPQAYGDLARYGYGTETGIGNAQADAVMDRNRASGQLWNTISGAAQMAAKVAGMGF
jgi:hypothetical protein